jgi:WD40 repeat protein
VTASQGQLAFIDVNDSTKRPRLVKLVPGSDGASGMAVRRSDGLLFVSYSRGAIGIVDVQKQSLVASIPAPASYSGSLSVSPDGRLLAASGSDGYIKVYDVAERTAQASLRVEVRETRAVAFSPDGRTLAALGSSNNVLYVWDMSVSPPELFVKLDLGLSAIFDKDQWIAQRLTSIAWLASDRLAAVSSDGKVVVVSLDENKWRARVRDLDLGSTN